MEDITQVSTNMVEPRYRTEYWREVTRPLFDCLPLKTDIQPTLEGSYKAKFFNPLMIGYATFGPQQFSRSWKIISRSGLEDFYLMQLFAEGTLNLQYDGPGLSIAKGDIYLFDFGRAFASQCSAGATYTFILRRDWLEKAIPSRKLHGLLFKADQPVTQLLSTIITGIMKMAPTMSDASAEAAENAIISVLAMAISHNAPVTAPGDPMLIPILRTRILDYIDANLMSPSLSIGMIMSRFRVSRAHLYRMFEPDGGVMRAVQERRLMAAYKHILRIPSVDPSRLAECHGFASAEQFQKVFQSKFDMTPKEAGHERSKLIVEAGRLSDIEHYLAGYAKASSIDEF